MTPTLFTPADLANAQHDAAYRAKVAEMGTREPKPLPEPDEDELFGSYEPSDLPSDHAKGYGKVSGIKGTGSPFHAREHYPRVIKLLQQRHPGWYLPVDRKLVLHSGMIVDQDWGGFMDICGFETAENGRGIGCNVTTAKSMAAHLRDWTSSTNTYGQGKTPVLTLLRGFLACGCLMYLAGSEQEGGKGSRWNYRIELVTEEILEKVIARKRK